MIWKSNGQQMQNGDPGVVITPTQKLPNNIRMATLKLTVTSTDNATNITCIAYSLSPKLSVKSGPALLLVQGMKMLPATIVDSHTQRIQVCWSQLVTSLKSPSTPLLSSSPGVLPSLWRGYPSWATMSPSPTPLVERMRQCQ